MWTIIAYQLGGAMGGAAVFFCGSIMCESCMHDGKGRTQKGHINAIAFLLGGTVVAAFAGAVAGGLLYNS